jgi:hypothetical protein
MFVPISGDFNSVADARQIAIATATDNPRFTSWCIAFEIEDETGKIVSKWTKGDHA